MNGSLPIVESRGCGECQSCCVWLSIPAGQVQPTAKPAGQPCPQLTAAGCGIYAERPALCARFRCAWLADSTWPDLWRPDRSGLLPLRELVDGVPVALVYETRAGALTAPTGLELVERLRTRAAWVVLVSFDGARSKLSGLLRVDGAEAAPPPAPHYLAARRREGTRSEAAAPQDRALPAD